MALVPAGTPAEISNRANDTWAQRRYAGDPTDLLRKALSGLADPFGPTSGP